MTTKKTSCRLPSLALVAGLLSTVPTCADAQATRDVTLSVFSNDTMALEYVARDNKVVARRYRIFGGTAARSVLLRLNRTGVTPTSPVRVFADDNGPAIATFTSDPVGTEPRIEVPGKVALVEMDWDTVGAAPKVTVSTAIRVGANANIASPTVSGTLQMQVNDPVEMFFSTTDRSAYYLWVRGVAGKKIDVVLDGPGRVFVSEPVRGRIIVDTTNGNPLPDAPEPLAVVDSTTGGLVRFDSAPADTLLFTITNHGLGNGTAARGHARFSVNEVKDAFPLRVWFNTSLIPGVTPFGNRSAAELTRVMTEIAQVASKTLYQATIGRVRLSGVEVFVQPNPAPARIDVRIDAIDQPWTSHSFGFQQTLGQIQLDERWFLESTGRAGYVLAHELFHYRYQLPDEYWPPPPPDPPPTCSNCLCPASIMSEPGDELCWSGNHNPYNDAVLAGRTLSPPAFAANTSMWGIMASRLGVTAPTRSPARVLRPASTVVFASTTFPGLGQSCSSSAAMACAPGQACDGGTCKSFTGNFLDTCDPSRQCGDGMSCKCPVFPHPQNCIAATNGCEKEVLTTVRRSCPTVFGACVLPCFKAGNSCVIDVASTVRQSCSKVCLP